MIGEDYSIVEEERVLTRRIEYIYTRGLRTFQADSDEPTCIAQASSLPEKSQQWPFYSRGHEPSDNVPTLALVGFSMAMYSSETAYQGEENIVLSIDIGTTYSAATFSYLYPGQRPEVRSVLKWPGQEDAAGDSKIPSIIAYQNGEVKFCGAEAVEYLDDDEYEISRWFKLHLHPDSMRISDQPPAYEAVEHTPRTIEIPALPRGVTLERVYVDFIQYVYKVAQNYFAKGTPNGSSIWDRLQSRIVIVLSTPNGWDIAQHTFLRTAVIKTGLIAESDADLRLQFITEGEASVHFALAHTNWAGWLKEGTVFAVTDAGGSTVDSTLYECKSTNPLVLEEVCASECVQAGGTFVDRAARALLTEKLGASRYGTDEWITAGVRAFERKTKRIFDGTQASNVVVFGSTGDNDKPHGILRGKLSLSKEEVSSTFEDVVRRTGESCVKLLQDRKIWYLLLVGGFGESPFLRGRLREILGDQGTEIVTVEEPSKKAAAEGATIWFIKQLVKARAARCTYGLEVATNYNPTVHAERWRLAQAGIDGIKRIPAFDVMVEKNLILSNDWKMIRRYSRKFHTLPLALDDVSVGLFAWEGTVKAIWLRGTTGGLMPGMRRLCVLKADMSGLKSSLTKHASPRNVEYWQLDYDVVVSFNQAKLQAKLTWKEKGVRREGPVTILPDAVF